MYPVETICFSIILAISIAIIIIISLIMTEVITSYSVSGITGQNLIDITAWYWILLLVFAVITAIICIIGLAWPAIDEKYIVVENREIKTKPYQNGYEKDFGPAALNILKGQQK